MPIYAYKCEECGRKYELFFKVKEDSEEIKCPDCGSPKANRLISAGAFLMGQGQSQSVPSCASGGGCSGASCPFAG